jgi:hypothetical protein
MSRVFPGVAEMRASFVEPVIKLINEDLPTLLRPIKANSGRSALGHFL